MKQFNKEFILFIVGGLSYLLVELAWRGYSHWTMFFVGGLCFISVGVINEIIPWEMPLKEQMFYGMCIVTTMEFISGLIINVLLGMNVWDYSDMPFNLYSQVCLPFSIAWYFVSGIAIVLDDYLRYIFFDEEKPRYT